MRVPLHDKVAGAAVVILLVGVLVLAGLGRPIPEYVTHAFTLAIGYLFRGGVGAANDYYHRRRAG